MIIFSLFSQFQGQVWHLSRNLTRSTHSWEALSPQQSRSCSELRLILSSLSSPACCWKILPHSWLHLHHRSHRNRCNSQCIFQQSDWRVQWRVFWWVCCSQRRCLSLIFPNNRKVLAIGRFFLKGEEFQDANCHFFLQMSKKYFPFQTHFCRLFAVILLKVLFEYFWSSCWLDWPEISFRFHLFRRFTH